ncbi:hypothetical protein QYF61_026417 [Mycteria americana]|uniref:Uncharacterized protein n=1 Tax=Mycteria americana TaxID=33587 RepID=A0AAN7S0B1_MYCAM|nr:hypothetical protein QYF61_026417 [Mycteria americana]
MATDGHRSGFDQGINGALPEGKWSRSFLEQWSAVGDSPLGSGRRPRKLPGVESPRLISYELCSELHGTEAAKVETSMGDKAKQSQLPQPLLIRLLLQTLHQLRCPSLDTLQYLNIPLVVGGPKLNTAFEVRPHQCRVQGHNHFPSPAGHAIFDTGQDAIGFLGRLGTLLAHTQVAVNQHPQVFLCQAAFQPLFSKPVVLHGVAVAQVQDPALGLVKPHTIHPSPSIQPVQVPLQSLPTLQQINTPTQLGVVCKLTESTLDPFIQIIDKDVKQNWPQHRALGNTACDRPPTGVNSIHHHSLGPAVQPAFYPAKSTPVQAMSSQKTLKGFLTRESFLYRTLHEAEITWFAPSGEARWRRRISPQRPAEGTFALRTGLRAPPTAISLRSWLGQYPFQLPTRVIQLLRVHSLGQEGSPVVRKAVGLASPASLTLRPPGAGEGLVDSQHLGGVRAAIEESLPRGQRFLGSTSRALGQGQAQSGDQAPSTSSDGRHAAGLSTSAQQGQQASPGTASQPTRHASVWDIEMPEREVRICERNNPADTKVSEGGGRGAPSTGAEIPLQAVMKPMVRQAVPLQPMEVHDGADTHLQPVEDPTPEQVDS